MCRWCRQGPAYQVGPVSQNECAKTSVPGQESSYQKADTNIDISSMKQFIKFIKSFMPLNITLIRHHNNNKAS